MDLLINVFFNFFSTVKCDRSYEVFQIMINTYPDQTIIAVNDRIQINTMIYMMPYYDRISP